MRIHFIGIGGVSMGFLAQLVAQNGISVSGSDLKLGGHRAENVIGADLAVYTNAIREDNPELIEARRRGIPIISRSER